MHSLENQNEEIPYRSEIAVPVALPVQIEDEQDYPTLKKCFVVVQEAEKKANSMDTLRDNHTNLTTDQLLVAYQFAIDEIIAPLKQQLISTIGDIKLKERGIIS